MRRLSSFAAGSTAVAALLSVAGVSTAGIAHADGNSPVVGHAYVNGNTVGTNTVDVLDRHADGSLTPAASSPVAIGGAGLGAGLGSQGAIEASPDGRFLLAVDAGSSEISVLRVGADGTPTLVGSPVPSGGVEPVSITISTQGIVYVANVGNGGSNYAGFRRTRWAS